jgi:hypothetical protein
MSELISKERATRCCTNKKTIFFFLALEIPTTLTSTNFHLLSRFHSILGLVFKRYLALNGLNLSKLPEK